MGCPPILLAVLLGGLLPGVSGQSTAPAKPASLDLVSNMVGWWKWDETTGTQAADSSKSGHPGVLQGGMTFEQNSVAGRNGKALKFAGGDNSVEITGYKGVTGTKPRTIAAWIKTATSDGEIVSWGHRDYGKMWTFGFVRAHVGVTPSGGYYYMKAQLNDNAWHHVAVVVQAANPPNLHDNVRLYQDGSLAEIDDIGLLDLWPIDTGSDLDVRIGRRFRGLLEDVRIYDRALTEDEIKALSKVQP